MKMTFQPKKRQRSKVHGFRARMSTPGGRKVLAARRAKGRKQLSAQAAICGLFFPFIGVNMKFTNSLRSNRDFKNVFKSGRSYANKYLVMYVSKNQLDGNRLGISVSKKVGNSVVRHRVKRLIKESYRLQENIFNSGLDIVVIARNNAADFTYPEAESALLHLWKLHSKKLDK